MTDQSESSIPEWRI